MKKRKILSAGSKGDPGDETCEPMTKKPRCTRKVKKAAPVPNDAAAPEVAPEVAEKPQRKPKRKSKGKVAEAEVTTPRPKAKAKAKAKAAPKSSPKRRAAPKSSPAAPKAKARTRQDALLHNPARSDPIIKGLMDFATVFPDSMDDPENGSKFKTAVRETLPEHESCWYNIYWTRNSCGLKHSEYKNDIAHFSFNTDPAPNRWKTAIAVRCAFLAVT